MSPTSSIALREQRHSCDCLMNNAFSKHLVTQRLDEIVNSSPSSLVSCRLIRSGRVSVAAAACLVAHNNGAVKKNQSPYPFIDKCIYCGSEEDLRKEHTIPYSLNGLLLLKKASCETCATITSRFEGSFMHDTLEVARAVMQYQTRRPKNRQQYAEGYEKRRSRGV